MSNFELKIALDAASLGRLYAFANYDKALTPAMRKAMDAGISLIQASATDYMWDHFQNPTGPMEEAWEAHIGPYQSDLTNKALYGRRRNYGFSGKIDSLGRLYVKDEGIMWAENTLTDVQGKIQDIFQAAIDHANLQLGRGTP